MTARVLSRQLTLSGLSDTTILTPVMETLVIAEGHVFYSNSNADLLTLKKYGKSNVVFIDKPSIGRFIPHEISQGRAFR